MEAAVEAVVQNIIVNSPLVQRRSTRPHESPIKFLFKEDHIAVGNKNSTTVAATAAVSVFDESQKTSRKKKNRSSIRNFFGGMITSVRNVMNQLITSPLDNSIPLIDCVAARGLTISNRPRTSDGGYAKLAIGSSCDRPQTSMENTVVEVCEKSTETTPSLYDQDSIDDFMFDTDEFDYLDDDDDDFSSYYEDENHSCVVCERAFFTSKQLERHQYKKRHWGCRICEDRFSSLILLEYHKEDQDHWSYIREDDRHYDLEKMRETMDDFSEEETEFGPNDEDREMLVTSAR